MLSKKLILKLFDMFNMKRWNDFISPITFQEMDKQGYKMFLAFLIASIEKNENNMEIDFVKLIEGSIFETLHRSILTDLRPSVSYKLMKEKSTELNAWVYKKLESELQEIKGDFKGKFKQYLEDDNYSKVEKEILQSAHFLATHWEFQIIEQNNLYSTRIKKAKKEINKKYFDNTKLYGVRKILLDSKVSELTNYFSELRFQERWAQALRIPKTNVLGHMYFVAVLSYFQAIEYNFCDKRIYNNFFVSLIHDFPEVLTRDIASPIKKSIEGLEHIIKEHEEKEMNENIYPLFPKYMVDEIRYFLDDEFSNRLILENKRISLPIEEMLNEKYNFEKFNPIDGKMLKILDNFSAYLEASMSIKYGIKSQHLYVAKEKLYNQYKDLKIGTVNYGELFLKFY